MLQILRNKAQSTVIQAIVVIIALVFIFWGVGTNMMNSRESAITVNDEDISFQDFQIAYDRTQQSIAAQFGGTLPKGLAETLGIKQQVIRQLVQSALLRQGAEKMGIIVSEEEIQNTITSMVQFQENGSFSMDKYKSLVSANRMTPHKFETNMRHDMLSEKTIRDLGKFASLASDFEVEELYRQDNEKVAVNFTKISPEQFKSEVKVDEAQLASWFETAKENYRSEPQMKLKYLNFSYAEVGKKISVDEARIAAYYDENIESFTTPEKRHARHILLKASSSDSEAIHKEKLAQAEQIAQLALASDDFAALARQYSEGPSKDNGGDLGLFSRNQMIPPFADAVWAMQTGEISKVVKTDFGYHIIKLEEIQPATTKSLADARDEILAALREKEAQALAFQLANSAYEGIIGAGSLQAYAEKTPDQLIYETDFFPKSDPPAGERMDEEFLNQAFQLKAGELSSLIKTPAGYYILFADAVKEPETPALAQVKEKATNDFVAEKAAELAQQKADEILKKLRDGETFAAVTTAANLSMNDSGFLGRKGEEQSAFPSSLTNQVFNLSNAERYPAEPAMVDEDYYVFGFKDRQIPEVDAKENLEPYRQALLQTKQQEILSAFISNLEKEAKISVHKSL
ncbi:SurA N-terminal domain-containing protein [Desulfopila aestuarii]|uniref:Periplasmic chaperone PpiD n=1 Tax=Desulfopila aestuarii DSM 18488 TaxID=1121416 RepID=A0A1M7Y518_9BACT|nr:SurA N-terminal domain-containing protein [Desulfopila aestuarii]SHO47469.1 peptidyl-prolyl cis-trans isomerase D [Desulfopila aestuarii DSM 18488]